MGEDSTGDKLRGTDFLKLIILLISIQAFLAQAYSISIILSNGYSSDTKEIPQEILV